MKRALLAVSGLLALCIAGLAVVVIAGREEESLAVDNLLAEELSLEIARSDVLRLADVASFPWDTVLVVEHGAPEPAIEAHLDEEWTGQLNFGTNDMLVFVRAGRVARYADYRGEGRLEGFERPVAAIAREDAVFEIEDLVVTPR